MKNFSLRKQSKISLIVALCLSLLACKGESVRSDQLKPITKGETVTESKEENGNTDNAHPQSEESANLISPIFRSYSLQYNEAEAKMNFSAHFSVNDQSGASVKLIDPSSIQFNQEYAKPYDGISPTAAFYLGLYINPIFWFAAGSSDAYFSEAQYAELNKDYEAVWVDPLGVRHSDHLKIPNINTQLHTYTIESGIPVNLHVYGVPANQEIKVRAEIRQNDSYLTSDYSNSYSGIPVSFTFTSRESNPWQEGKAEIIFEISYEQELQDQQSLGGKAKISFQTKPTNIQLRK